MNAPPGGPPPPRGGYGPQAPWPGTPTVVAPVHRAWQLPHIPNTTGTEAAYRPPGHTLEGGHRARATGDYQAWTPS